jgi:TIR domain-containing protein
MGASVFISHSSHDHEIAVTVCEALERRGLGCWLSSRDIGPGENFQEAIVKAISSVHSMVLVFTGSANNSDEIKKEIALASHNHLAVIPLRVEDVVPTDAFQYELSTRQWVDAFDDWDRAMSLLADQISRIGGKRATPPNGSVPYSPAVARPAASMPHGASDGAEPGAMHPTTHRSAAGVDAPRTPKRHIGLWLGIGVVVGVAGVFILASIIVPPDEDVDPKPPAIGSRPPAIPAPPAPVHTASEPRVGPTPLRQSGPPSAAPATDCSASQHAAAIDKAARGTRSALYNQSFGIVRDGTAFSCGIDGMGNAYSAHLLGTGLVWKGVSFRFGPANGADVISAAGQTIPLTAGRASSVSMLALAVNGQQTSQVFIVNYTDGTNKTFTQGISDWLVPAHLRGESVAKSMAYRDTSEGGRDDRPFNLYGYSFATSAGKTVKSITLPSNPQVKVLAIAPPPCIPEPRR